MLLTRGHSEKEESGSSACIATCGHLPAQARRALCSAGLAVVKGGQGCSICVVLFNKYMVVSRQKPSESRISMLSEPSFASSGFAASPREGGDEELELGFLGDGSCFGSSSAGPLSGW